MSPILLIVALCAQEPPGPSTVTAADGTVYRVSYTPISQPIGMVGPPPSSPPSPSPSPAATTPGIPPEGLYRPASPAYPSAQSWAAPTQQSPPTAVRRQPPTYGYRVTQTVELRQPGAIDRAIAAIGLRLCQRGLPRPRISGTEVSCLTRSPATLTYTVAEPEPPAPTYPSPQR